MGSRNFDSNRGWLKPEHLGHKSKRVGLSIRSCKPVMDLRTRSYSDAHRGRLRRRCLGFKFRKPGLRIQCADPKLDTDPRLTKTATARRRRGSLGFRCEWFDLHLSLVDGTNPRPELYRQ